MVCLVTLCVCGQGQGKGKEEEQMKRTIPGEDILCVQKGVQAKERDHCVVGKQRRKRKRRREMNERERG